MILMGTCTTERGAIPGFAPDSHVWIPYPILISGIGLRPFRSDGSSLHHRTCGGGRAVVGAGILRDPAAHCRSTNGAGQSHGGT